MPDEETKDAGVDAEGGPQLDKNNALSYKKVEKRVHTKVPSFLGGSKAAAKPANDEASAREKFEALAGGAGKEITLKQYKQLMTKLCKGSPGAAPKERDLELAFTLADQGQRGRMDVDDFASVFALVQRGQVEGLAGDRKTGNTVAGKKELEIKKTQFCDAIKMRRDEMDGTVQKVSGKPAGKTRKSLHQKELGSIPEGEYTANAQKHAREHASTLLANEHDKWNAKKDHHTVAKNMGHLETATAASKHAHDKHTADNTSEAEMIAYQKVHGREESSKALSKAHEDWEKRDHHTVAKDMGHLAQATAASKHAHDKHTADNTSEAEMIAYQKVHAREETSKALSKAHEEWEKRDHHTVAKDMGHLAQATAASKHAHDKHTADNTSEAEMIAYQRVHAREEASKALTKAHEEWDKRDHSGTKTDKLGHFATATAASSHHHDKHTADNVPEAEHIAYMQAHERQEASKQLAKEHAAFDARKASMVGGNHTEADHSAGLDHLLHETEASKAMHKKAFRSKSELEVAAMKRERETMGLANDAAKTAWQKRMAKKKHSFTLPVGASAHFAAETESSAHRHDKAAVDEAHASYLATHGRQRMEEAGLQASAEYEKRMAKKKGLTSSPDKKGSRSGPMAPPPPGKHDYEEKMEAAAREQSAKAGEVLSKGRAAIERARAAAAVREAVRKAKEESAMKEVEQQRRIAGRKSSWRSGPAFKAAPQAKSQGPVASARNPKKGAPLAFVPNKFAFWRKGNAPTNEAVAADLSTNDLNAARAQLASLKATRGMDGAFPAGFNEKIGTSI